MKYFISGHSDLPYEDFENYYFPKIQEIFDADRYPGFVIGDCYGADKFAMDYILNNSGHLLTIYHMFDKPRNIPSNLDEDPESAGVFFKGGFKSDEERDSAMTEASDFDIAFIKDNRWNSGTAQNIKRRHNI